MGYPSLIKPSMWAFIPALVDPKWNRFHERLTSAVLFWDNIIEPYELVSGLKTTQIGSQTVTHGTIGQDVLFATGSNQNIAIVSEAIAFPRTTHGTILYIRRKTDTTDRISSHFGVTFSGTSRIQTHNPFQDGVTYWDWGSTGDNGRISATVPIDTDIEYWVFVAGPAGLAFYKDGILHASNSVAAHRDAQSGSFYVNRGQSTVGDNQECYLIATFDDAWTANQVRDWSVDPWGPFRMIDEVGVVVAVLAAEFTSANLALHHSGASDIGGAIAAVLTDDALNNIWDDVSSGDASAGDTEYRCSYVKNTHATQSVANVAVEIGTDPTESNWEIALGAAGLNGTETEVANENTAPSTPTFGTGSIAMGTLAAGDSYPFWIKRIVTAGAGAATPDSGVLNVCGDDPN